MKNWKIYTLCILILIGFKAYAEEKPKLSFRDPVDSAFDLSNWILNYNGFVPVPTLITEPALGNFGLGVGLVFIKQNQPYDIDGVKHPAPPTILGVGGMYTANKSWAGFVGGTVALPKYRMQIKGGGGYADINMDFYFKDLLEKERKLGFNFTGIPVFITVGRVLRDPRFSIDLEYTFMDVNVKMKNPFENLPDELIDFNFEKSQTISKGGLRFSFDTRDNVFTPNQGIKTYLDVQLSNQVLGSDFDYEQAEAAFYWYLPLHKKWINGFRFDMQQAFDNPPFYLKPFVDMRGLPAMRYQGKTTMLVELEERWDVYKRWSAVFFGGVGTGFDKWKDFGDAEWAYSYGAGFRYLLARPLNLRCGMDFAMGPEGFAYYVVFGSSWLRQ